MDYTNELRHHGVKGMKWGVRKDRRSSSRTGKGSGKQNDASAAQKAKRREKTIRAVAKGAEVASKLALTSAVDDVFYGGAGKKIAKEAVVQTGRAAVTAYTMARGGYDIKWYDKHGRRVG